MINQAVPSFTVRRHFFLLLSSSDSKPISFFLASPVFAVLFFFVPGNGVSFFVCLFV